MANFNLRPLGGGIGLRHKYFEEILEQRPPCNWFEIIIDDFVGDGGRDVNFLRKIQEHYPIVGHGVCCSLGSTDPIDVPYIRRLKSVLDTIKSPWFSDHLCFTMVDHTNLNDLIPLPFTTEAARNVVERIKVIQDIIERPFLIENVTRYVTVSSREMGEAEFLATVLEGADCGLLLDVTNLYLNSQFHRYDPLEFLRSIPYHRVGQMHLAGWTPADDGTIIDSHDAPVTPDVWNLFKEIVTVTGPSSVLVEWDNALPPLRRLLAEADAANQAIAAMCGKGALQRAA
ncbi:MAG: hypothetical protein RL417_1726 [Pseudomonadota bacterium]|jgi:uncharacterized protein (UPF0276 family)